MNVKIFSLLTVGSLALSPLAYAQSNPTTLGTEGPASNSAGYPSGQTPQGRLTTTQVGPQGATTQSTPTVRRHPARRRYRNPNPS